MATPTHKRVAVNGRNLLKMLRALNQQATTRITALDRAIKPLVKPSETMKRPLIELLKRGHFGSVREELLSLDAQYDGLHATRARWQAIQDWTGRLLAGHADTYKHPLLGLPL